MKKNDESLPTIYAKCESCDKRGPGSRPGRYYGSSFTGKQWSRGPVCENCSGPLTIVREVVYSEALR